MAGMTGLSSSADEHLGPVPANDQPLPAGLDHLPAVHALDPEQRTLLQQFLRYCDRNSLPLLCIDANSNLRFPDGLQEFVLSPQACVELMRGLRNGQAVNWGALPRQPAGSDRDDAAP